MHDYRKLDVWKESFSLTLSIYTITKTFPSHEMFGITSQLRRASSSVSANIAEGSGMKTKKAFSRYITISLGSALEVETFLLLSKELGYLDKDTHFVVNDKNRKIIFMLKNFNKTLFA